MKTLQSIDALSSLSGPLVLVGGTFDGVHLGHQALIRRAQEEARSCGGQVVVMTFDQHPVALLRPIEAPSLLTRTAQKTELFKALGVDVLLLLTFDATFAATPAEQFIQSLVEAASLLKALCVGTAWSFGQGGKGNLALLRQLGERWHFSVITIAPIEISGEVVSSTRIRRAIARGDLDEAAACLGYRYALCGLVLRGAGRGKTLGFPTANLELENQQLPPDGVYTAVVDFKGVSYHGVVNIGCRPTIEPVTHVRTVEIHLFDFKEDLYGQNIKVEPIFFLRNEMAFPNLEALKNQIQRDVDIAKKRFQIGMLRN